MSHFVYTTLSKINKFDVVVLVGPNDLDIVHKQLTYTKKNIVGYRNIYLVSCDKDLQIEKTITIYEKDFPFKIENIKDFVVKNNIWNLISSAQNASILSFFLVTFSSGILIGSIPTLLNLLSLMNDVVDAKRMIIDKLNQANRMPMFLRTVNGFKITDQEGFVAIDKLKGGAVKLVNRLEFSKANFSPDIIKGWQK